LGLNRVAIPTWRTETIDSFCEAKWWRLGGSISGTHTVLDVGNNVLFSLSQQMIRMGSSSSILHQQSPASQSTPTTSSGQAGHVHPSLDVTTRYNPHLPFSSLGAVSSRNSLATPFGSTN